MTTAELDRAVAAEERLAEDLKNYAGRWVAIRDHEVVADAATAAEIATKIDPSEVDRIIEVTEADTVAYY